MPRIEGTNLSETSAETFRAMVVFQGYSGRPEDRFVNTLHFFATSGATDTAERLADVAPAIKAMIEGFYSATEAGGKSILSYMPQTGITSASLKLYDLMEPVEYDQNEKGEWYVSKPRTLHEESLNLSPASVAPVLPFEVALVLSYHSGVRGPRNRGRIYLGPFTDDALASSSTRSTPVAALLDAVQAGALDLLNSTQPASWAQYSPTANKRTLVAGGWVDDAWDTQRRRGQDAQARHTWGSAL